MKIQNLFIPEVFQSYYPSKITFVSIHITHAHVHVSTVTAHGYARTILASKAYPVEKTDEDHHKNLIATLKKIKTELTTAENLIITIPGSSVVFKELTLPFTTREKIAMVLPLEIEPYLPFASTEAIIDFMITSTHQTEKKSTIMVAAVQKKYINDQLELYAQAEIYPTQIVVDSMAVLSFVRHFTTHHANFCLIAVDEQHTTLAYYPDNTLRAIRIVDTHHAGKNAHTALNFTLNAFEDTYGPVSHYVLTGAYKKEEFEAFAKESNRNLEHLAIHHSDSFNPKITLSTTHHEQAAIFSDAAAVPTAENTEFNLIPTEVQQQRLGSFFAKQIIGAGLLSLLLVGSLTVHTVLQIRKLSRTATTLKTDTLKEIKKRFPTVKSSNLSAALKTAQKEVAVQQELWSAFSGSTGGYLYYLAALSSAIDRDSLGLTLNKMIMNKKTITLEGKVQSFEALEALEKRLKDSDLFVKIPDLQKTDFSIALTLKSQGDNA